MRVRIARSFSTSLRRAEQALYEPYVATLNEEQKKSLRKVMAKALPTYNGNLNKDIKHFLSSYEPLRSTLNRRKETLQRVQGIINSAFGSEYTVIDRSLYTYARDVEIAPLELAIHDNSRPRGFLPGTEDQPLPDPYNHEVLAELLQRHGYTGCFVFGDAERMTPLDASPPVAQLVEEKGMLPAYPPWPSFTPSRISYLTYPPVLHAQNDSLLTLPFFLSPPVPTHLPLRNLLKAYCSLNESFSNLITLILLWVRSIDLPQMTPTCIALMVIGFLQNRKSVPSLQNPHSPEDLQRLAEADEGVWIRAECSPRYPPRVFWLETAFVMPFAPKLAELSRPKHLGPLLFDFFYFWSQQSSATDFISSDQCLSVRKGSTVSRAPVIKHTVKMLQRDEDNERSISRGEVPWSPTDEPIMWQTQHIVVQDPFIPSYNHAQSLSKSAATYFHYFNSLSQRTLFRGHPMATVLGPHLPPFTKGSQRGYSTGSIGHEARQMYESTLPPQSVLAARARTISRVQKVIKDKFGTAYSVECFGSTRYGVSSATSDLDLVIMDPNRSTGFSPKERLDHLPDVYDTKLVARTLWRKGFTDVLAIPKATVPIVKFRDPTTGLECDLNTNDQLGLWNTLLIQRYCDLTPLARPMIMVIKQWAKSHGLNNPSGRNGPVTFSSYALVLMVIGYLQIRGVLPNLQAGLRPLSKETQEGIFWLRTTKRDRMRCDIRCLIEQGWQSGVQMDLGEALEGWFIFWSKEHQYDKELLDIRQGGLIKRAANQQSEKKKKKKKKTKAIPLSQFQEEVRRRSLRADIREQEEVEAVAAWQSQHESGEEEEDAGLGSDKSDEVEVIDVTNESETTGSEESHDAGKVVGHSKSNVPPAADVGYAPDEETAARLQLNAGMQYDAQPSAWASNLLIVADPFIRDKNVCKSIIKNHIERFKEECRRSALLLSWEGGLRDIMGNGNPLSGAPRRGRRGRTMMGGDGRGGRGRGERGGRGGRGGMVEFVPNQDAGNFGGARSPGSSDHPGQRGGKGKGRGNRWPGGAPPNRGRGVPNQMRP